MSGRSGGVVVVNEDVKTLEDFIDEAIVAGRIE